MEFIGEHLKSVRVKKNYKLSYIAKELNISNEILSLNGIQILSDIGLGNSITSQRMNGFLSALKTIKVLVNVV